MSQEEFLRMKKLREAIIPDVVIDDILTKLDNEELELIADSLLGALNGGCDEFFHRLFEELIPRMIDNDKHGKWKLIRDTLVKRWNEKL